MERHGHPRPGALPFAGAFAEPGAVRSPGAGPMILKLLAMVLPVLAQFFFAS